MDRFILSTIIISLSLSLKAQSLQRLADSLMSANQIPELGFAVVSPDTILELNVLGFRRIDLKNEQTRASQSDYFHLGSNTKAITGFVAAYLVEAGKIQWTTKFFDLFPKWKRSSNPAYYKITLADLLSHRAKIHPYTNGLEFEELPDFEGSQSEQRKLFAKHLLLEKPVKTDNTFNYSNAGYSIAALMLESVSKKTWEQLTNEIMTKHLKVNIEYSWPNRTGLHQPYGHSMENGTLTALPPETAYNLALAEPAGDISMSLPDYAKFIQFNLKGLAGIDNVLRASSYEFLHFGLKDYSIGWGNSTNGEEKVSQHSGSAGTFFAHTLIDKKRQLAFILLSNSATEKTKQSIFKLLSAMKKKYSK